MGGGRHRLSGLPGLLTLVGDVVSRELGPAPWARLQCLRFLLPAQGGLGPHSGTSGCGRFRTISHAVQGAPSFKGGSDACLHFPVQTHQLPPDSRGPRFSPDLRLPIRGVRGAPRDWIPWEEDRGGGTVPMVQTQLSSLDPRPTSSLGSGGQSPGGTPGSHHQDVTGAPEGTLKMIHASNRRNIDTLFLALLK